MTVAVPSQPPPEQPRGTMPDTSQRSPVRVQHVPAPTPAQLEEQRRQRIAPVALELQKWKGRIEPLLPKGITFEAVVSDVWLASRENRSILACDPGSVIVSVCRIQQWRLQIGVTAYLIPFREGKGERAIMKCEAVPGYRGLIQMCVGSGACHDINAYVHYEKDDFELVLGDRPGIKHIPLLAPDRGRIKGAYAVAVITNGRTKFEYMTVDEIEAIRAESKMWNPGKHRGLPPWYAKKTAIRRIAKYLPWGKNSVQLMQAVASGGEDLPALNAVEAEIVDATHGAGPISQEVAAEVEQEQARRVEPMRAAPIDDVDDEDDDLWIAAMDAHNEMYGGGR